MGTMGDRRMTDGFTGASVIVTGGAGGIGRTTAQAFAREGAKVVVADRDEIAGAETVRLIEAAGGTAHFVAVDVSLEASVEAMVRAAVARFGRLDYAFNNAGIALGAGRLADLQEDLFDRVMAVNVKGVWLCMKHELRQMLAQGGGAIVNSGSIGSFSGMSFERYGDSASTAYIASKHAVIGLTRVAAMDYAKDNIRVNAVCPGVVRTAMYEESLRGSPARRGEIAAMHPMGRIAESEDVAQAVLWLCSSRAGFVTGHALSVDGGYGAA